VVGGDEGVDGLLLAGRTDRRGLAGQLHATTIQLVHPSEIGGELLGDKLLPHPWQLHSLVADRGLRTGGLEKHGLVPPFARLVTGAQASSSPNMLFSQTVVGKTRRSSTVEGATKPSRVREPPKGASDSCPGISFALLRPPSPKARRLGLRLSLELFLASFGAAGPLSAIVDILTRTSSSCCCNAKDLFRIRLLAVGSLYRRRDATAIPAAPTEPPSPFFLPSEHGSAILI
jgi:hypothetical protein